MNVYLVLTSCVLTTINQGRMKEPPTCLGDSPPPPSIFPFLPCQRIRLTSSFTSQLLPPHAVSAISDGIIVVFFGHSVMPSHFHNIVSDGKSHEFPPSCPHRWSTTPLKRSGPDILQIVRTNRISNPPVEYICCRCTLCYESANGGSLYHPFCQKKTHTVTSTLNGVTIQRSKHS
jgi:hypothetical protein